MILPVAIAGLAINLVIAIACLFVRFRRAGRDWLVPMGISHLLASIGYAVLAPFPSGPELRNTLSSPLGPVVALVVAGIIGCIIAGTMHLRFGTHIWRTATAIWAAIWLTVMASALLFSYGAAMQVYSGALCLTAFICGTVMLGGPSAFYPLTGLSLIGRGIMTALLVALTRFTDSDTVFATVGILNIVFIAATGFGMILIELDDARQRAFDADLAKSQFIANMSHELRTPLNAIIGFSEILQGGVFRPSSEQVQNYAGVIHGAGQHLLGIVNDLLDMAMIEARHENLQFEPVRVDKLIDTSIGMLAGEAERKGIVLRSQGCDMPVDSMTDSRALRQILINLLGNAVKFSPPGGEVGVYLERHAGPSGRADLLIRVADHGPGMDAKDLQHIFEPFWQAGDTFNRAHGGVGLGLAIAHRLAKALGATLTVESKKGQGSVFTVILPHTPPKVSSGKLATPAPEVVKPKAT